MADMNPTITTITLNINILIGPIKKQGCSGWTQKQNLTICCLHETHFKFKTTNMASLKAQMVSMCLQCGKPGLTAGSGRLPTEGHGSPLQYSSLESSMDRGDWQRTVYEIAESTRLSD